MKNLIIVGISETAKRVYDFVNRYKLYNVIGFTVNKVYIQNDMFLSKPVFPLENLDNYIDKKNDLLFVAIFWNRLNADRRKVFEKIDKAGYNFANIVSPLASVRGRIGKNCWIMDYVVIQEEAVVDDNVFIADFTLIGNMAQISKHVFCAVKSCILGSCKIGIQSFVGSNATIFDETEIGEKCIVGACTIVKRNLPRYSVVKTNTNNMITKEYQSDVIESKWMAHHNIR